MPVDVISACYALSVTAGGIMGYVKAGSAPSLLAGLAFGSLLGYGAYQTSIDEKNYYFSFAVSTVLGMLMGYRFYNSGKFMPAGLIASMSAMMILRFTARYLSVQKQLQ